MNIAIGIGTLLLGGWVLNTPADTQPGANAPDAAAQTDEAIQQQGGRRGAQNPERMVPRDQAQQKTREQNRLQGRQPSGTQAGKQPGGQQGVQPRTGQQPGVGTWMPSSPTDSVAGAGGLMPMAPTTSQEEMDANTRAAQAQAMAQGQSVGPMTTAMPDMPTSRRAYAPRTAYSPTTYDTAARQRMQTQVGTHPSSMPQAAPPEKAFSGYRPSSSGVSPYMNLFRNDTAGGTIDNYTTFVRPALDQRSMNQQFNMDLYGLERNSRLQQSAMRSMYQNSNRTLQSVGTPQYMNYGNYYGGRQGLYGQGQYTGPSPYGERSSYGGY